MKRIFLFVMVTLLSFTIYGQRQYLSFNQGVQEYSNQQFVPDRIVNTQRSQSIEIQFKFDGALISDAVENDTSYNFLHVGGFHKMAQVGAPALPAKNEIIAIPQGATSKIVILEADYVEYQGYNIYPTLQPATDREGDPEPEFEKDYSIYNKDEFFPENVVEIVNIGLSRGTQLAKVQIRPVQFNPVTKTIKVYTNIKFEIVYSGGQNNFDYIANDNSIHYTNLLKANVINSDDIPDGVSLNQTNKSGAKNYIIITHEEFLTQANQLANWKRQLGYSVEVVSQSSWTSAQVSDAISDRYDTWSPKPDYFVIIGDHDGSYAVPGEMESDPYYGDPFATDLYYACMDGSSDWHPDMAHGRISVTSVSEAQTVIDKIIGYELTPVATSSFYDNVLNCAQWQDTDDDDGYADRRFCHTSEDIRNYLQDNQGYTSTRVYYRETGAGTATVSNLHYNDGYYSNGALLPAELRTAAFDWSGGSTEITNEIDAGKFLVFHRDHGYTGGSGWAHPYYTTSSMDGLSNGDLQPVVLSINCHTGEFQQSNCFAEKFLRMDNKGAVGVVGATYFSLSGYNDAISIGMIDAIWADPGIAPVFGSGGSGNSYTIGAGNSIYTMGDVVNQGLYCMEQNWGGSSTYEQYEYELFMYFGDPAMKIWTANPNDNIISATHDATIDCANSTFSIIGSTPGATATLVYNDELIGETVLDGSGNGTINYSLSVPGDVTLTISLHNNKPYVSTLTQTCAGYPPTVETNAANSVTQSSATINGEIISDQGETITQSGFVYSTSPNPIIGGVGVTDVQTDPLITTGTFSEDLTGLTSATTYYYKAYAVNNNGVGYGAELTFTTLKDAIFYDGFETDEGWTYNGEWERDAPQGLQGDSYGNPDPTSAFNGSNVLGVDLTGLGTYPGDYENNLTDHEEYAISPVINCTGYVDIELEFQRWLGVEQPQYDHAYIDISTDGGSSWTELWSNSETVDENAWSTQTFDISTYADEEAMVQIRFSMGESDGSWQYAGWNIDDFYITGTPLIVVPTATATTTPGCGTGSVIVSSDLSGYQTFYLCDAGGNVLQSQAVDATSYEFTGLSDGTYTGKVEKNGETSALSSQVTLTNLSSPVAATSASATSTEICNGNSTTLSYTGGSGATFVWYSGSCGNTQVGTGNDLSVTPTSTSTYYGRWENTCGESSCIDVTITVNDLIIADAGDDDETCGNTYNLSANNPAPGTGQWSVIGGAGSFSDASDPNAVLTITSSPVTVEWIITNGTCVSSEDITITMSDAPVAATSASATSTDICNGSETTLSYSGGSGTTFVWYTGSCGNTQVGTGNDLSVTPTETTIYYGRWENTCGESSCVDVTITVSDEIVAIAGDDDETCDETYSLSANNPAPGTGQWTILGGGASISDDTDPNAVLTISSSPVTLSWTITNGACISSEDITISMLDEVQIVSQPVDLEIFETETAIFTVTVTGSNIQYQWQKDGVDITDGANISGANTEMLTIIDVTTADAGIYSVNLTNDCGAVTSDNAVLSVISNIQSIKDLGIIIYPNPSNGEFFVRFNEKSEYLVKIYDQAGRLVLDDVLTEKVNNIDISNQAPGVYSLIISGNEKNATVKIIVK